MARSSLNSALHQEAKVNVEVREAIWVTGHLKNVTKTALLVLYFMASLRLIVETFMISKKHI